jgi:hypothetical protein
MKTISLWNPWAMWVALGWKTIETRTHLRFRCLLGQEIGIHAARKWDPAWATLAGRYINERQEQITTGHKEAWRATEGCVIATAFVYEFASELGMFESDAALIDCSHTRRSGLFLRDIKQLKTPIFWPGRQGIFNLPLPGRIDHGK